MAALAIAVGGALEHRAETGLAIGLGSPRFRLIGGGTLLLMAGALAVGIGVW